MFIKSVFDITKRPTDLPNCLLVGRSNVGKSSFINALFERKSLAKVSKTPGKTLGLNYYLFKDFLYIVDAPGYGYAKRDFSTRDKIEELIVNFLNKKCANLIFQLIDFKVGFTNDDLNILQFLIQSNQKVVIIFTKDDKVKHKDRQKTLERNLKIIGKLDYIITSSESKKNINHVIEYLKNFFKKDNNENEKD